MVNPVVPLQTRITVRAVKVAEHLSEETLAFSATVYFDGKKIASAKNDGHGGATHLYAFPGENPTLEEMRLFARSLPPTELGAADPNDPAKPWLVPTELDLLIDLIVGQAQDLKRAAARFTRLTKTSVLMLEAGKILSIKPKHIASLTDPAYLAAVADRYPAAQILNTLPKDSALALFLQHG